MATLKDAVDIVGRLSPEDYKKFMALIMALGSKTDLEQIISEERFSGGLVCTHCGCKEHIVRNGHRKDGRQRYLCRDCEKSFLSSTNSIASGSHKSFEIWQMYVGCMMSGLSVRKTAEMCGIHRNTAFVWRHKILDALSSMLNAVKLDGIIEADETFFSISYKGNHKKRRDFVMPRRSHRRGMPAEHRGISKEKVCVPCAIDRSGNSVAKIANLGRVSAADLHNVYDGRIKEHAVICTDKMNSYVRFAKKNGFELVQLKSGKTKKGIYHIQHINAFHNGLKRFIRPFNGVSTKYLNNYLVWNHWVNIAKGSINDKAERILKTAIIAFEKVRYMDIPNRETVPVL